MLLSIIIPRHNEPDNLVKRLLASIDYQLNVDWSKVEIIIIDDCSDSVLKGEMLNGFDNIKPTYFRLDKNVGPGLARQIGLDKAQGEYVAFCDADDMYQNFGVFSLFFSEIEKTHPEIFTTSWLEELIDENGNKRYLPHSQETTWVHGKIFNREFLSKNYIRFSPELRCHEDTYFLANAFAMATNARFLDVTTFVWMWNNSSLTRRNKGAYTYTEFEQFITAADLSIVWLKDRGKTDIADRVLNVLMYCFCYLQSHDFEQAWIDRIEKHLSDVIKKYEQEITRITYPMICAMYTQERNKILTQYLDKETFDSFLERISHKKLKHLK